MLISPVGINKISISEHKEKLQKKSSNITG